jgi:DNA (cytosine-5)-methyltransferase 1
LNYLSVCSGIEAATVAWHHMGWNPIAFSEIEKFPSQVLAHHYPNVPNLGDMTKYKEWKLSEPIDILVGGTPCQSFSVAGLRKGLDDPRGNLALTYVGILDKFRPKWCVWENVPGVLSSGGGRDFGSFLGALGEIGYGWAYRVLDAQYFGVAQRRKRVFVIGYLGDWKPAAEILFESESLSGNTEKGRKARKEVAGEFVPSVANCIQTTCNDYSRADGFNMIAVGAFGKNISDTVTAKFAKGAELLQQGAQNGGNCVLQPIATKNHTAIVIDRSAFNQGKNALYKPYIENTETMPTLISKGPHAVMNKMVVRRLTEVECERLQGFPNNYTNIKENCPSGARYKSLGNSMAVPVMRWIGERINQYEQRGVEKHL